MKHRSPARLRLASVVLLVASTAHADAWHHSVSLPASLEHDSNFRMSPVTPQGINRFIFTPTYSLTGTCGLHEISASLGMRSERSSDRKISMNRDDPNLRFGWRRLTETGEFGLNARYEQASSQQTQLQETGLVVADSTRTSKSLGARWQAAVTERSTLAANLDYQNVSFDGGQLTNYENLSAGLNWGYAWNEIVEPFWVLTASHYEPERATTPSSDNYTLQAGARVKFAENWDWSVQAGMSRVVARVSDNSWLGNTNLAYNGLRHNLSLSAARAVSASGEGGYVQSDQFKGAWGYAFDDLTRFGLDASWQESRGLQPNTMKQLGASASRELSPFLTARLYYQHKQRLQDGLPEARGDVLGMTLLYTHPDF